MEESGMSAFSFPRKRRSDRTAVSRLAEVERPAGRVAAKARSRRGGDGRAFLLAKEPEPQVLLTAFLAFAFLSWGINPFAILMAHAGRDGMKEKVMGKCLFVLLVDNKNRRESDEFMFRIINSSDSR
ncbi:MAG: hypothetical protein SO013_00890 [Prevotella sp.]|nr:hypothetical protein [Prevotella sp.]